ncbi:beta-aspartyl-peptidase [Gudongella sp. SC589]|jgi:beta-aspartyl-dipeptidase (metallo-type)|uniref:beta-aspartyl-peptidase n=1 Tax=Gudongella sp. SC589 TaxID=3385990 RepID=UPI003904B65D
MLLIKKVNVFSPESLGTKDVMIINEKIIEIGENLEPISDRMEVIDGSGKTLVPGLIDGHVHLTGGGGEGSFRTRVPDITLSRLIEGGITTVLGLLGTDSTTRNVENLVAKAKALNEEGITSYALTGSYGYPSVTLTDSVKKDITYINEIIGVKIAISDHRAPSTSKEELARLASDARVAGMLSGKAGVVVTHMGEGKGRLKAIREVLETWDLPMKTFIPTHVNRNDELLKEALDYARQGGTIDLTCGIYDERTPGKVVAEALKNGVPAENITISSDGYGSWSKYDEKGNLLKIGVSSVSSLYNELTGTVKAGLLSLEAALPFFTTNVARALGLEKSKGRVARDMDADLLILDGDLKLDYVIARGKVMMKDGQVVVRGTYE